MAQVYVKYNPYRLETVLKVNGKDVPTDSVLYKVTKGKRLQEWVGQFPKMLREELNTVDFSLEFCGMPLDWDDFEYAFEQAKKSGVVKVSALRFIEGKSDEDINEKIVKVFEDLQDGPIDDFRDPRLVKAFKNVNNAVFPVNVVATMSSGKSTLINALLGKKLMPSKNEACTATITEILDVDTPSFYAKIYGEDNVELEEIPELTYDIMNRLNDDARVQCIAAEGDIPFLDSKSTKLKLVDTPGPNNSQNQAHKNTTYRAINNDSNNLILYVLNGTQLSTNDDASLLRYVADQMKKGGKQVRDRFLFVINKMDQFNPEEESIEKAILAAKRYLGSYGIEDPQLFPCSAFAALNIKTELAGIDIDNLTRSEERKLSVSARDTLGMIDKLVEFESMHLEKYTALSPSAQQELDYRLARAVERGDTKEQALIHSGICSIEAAITAYVKKYAKTKKVKDLVETFQEVLESSKVLATAKERVQSDEATAKAFAERAAAIQKKIDDGEEAQRFRETIADLNPMPTIEDKADQLKANATTKTNKIFAPLGDKITSRDEAKHIVAQFYSLSSDAMAELTSELESTINTQIVDTGERLLQEYQEKLNNFDETAASDEKLDFDTVSLVKGALKSIRDTADKWTTDDFAAEMVDDVGETSYEDRTIYEKTGQVAEEVVCGSHQEKVGTKKVKVGSHREQVGTRKERNPDKKWWKIFTPRYITVPVYETVDDYKDEDVYKTVLEYETVMRDVFEERTERIEKFSVDTSLIQTALVAKMRKNLDDGVESALGYASNQVDAMKAQFARIFDALDMLIKQKYEEITKCAQDQEERAASMKANQNLLNWIEANLSEIDSILDL